MLARRAFTGKIVVFVKVFLPFQFLFWILIFCGPFEYPLFQQIFFHYLVAEK